MRRLLSLVVCLAVTGPLMAAVTYPATLPDGEQAAATTKDVAFFTGCWVFERGGRKVEEHWMAPAGGSLMGLSRTTAGPKTVEYEFLQIRDTADGLVYIAKPSGQAEATFKVASLTAEEVVFENPTHDFPQRIKYRRVGADELHARVEGTRNGKTSGFDLPYKRTNCVP